MKIMQNLSRRNCLAFGACSALLPFTGPARAAAPIDVVVELFSSQGCSSCPPGDRLAAELRNVPGVLALTYHVDYWDYLGWKDTLGSADFSQRQYDYAKARGDMDVFTPQMVINGEKQVVGSQRSEVFAVMKAGRQAKWPVSVALSDGPRDITVTVGAGEQAMATLWVMTILDRVTVKIEKGEIAGKEITYVNVVRRLVPAGMWKGEAMSLSLPKDALMTADSTACVALLQEGKVGRVLGCASWGSVTS